MSRSQAFRTLRAPLASRRIPMRFYPITSIAGRLVAMATIACGGATTEPTSDEARTVDTNVASQSAAISGSETVLPHLPSKPTFSASTIPPNGDVNPYGVAFVPNAFPHGGLLRPGDIIVSNFNNVANVQGTGTTIVRVNPGARP